jgi:glycerol kinase
MAEPLVLAIDQGTHASRALVFDGRGHIVAQAVREVGIAYPQPGWAEQDAAEVLASVADAVEGALRELGPRAAEVNAAGLAIQRSSNLCWDRETGAALSPVISWQDRRTAEWVAGLAAHGETVHRRNGLFLSPHYGASKLRWCLDQLPAVRRAQQQRRLCWGPLASFLLFRLLRERPHKVDPQCASRTQLWNLETRTWDPELTALFGVPREVLPRCVPTRHAYGTLESAGVTFPLTALNGDAAAGLFAFGWPDAEAAYLTVGTGAFLLQPQARLPPYAPRELAGIVLEDEHAIVYMLEGTINGAGSALDWLAAHLELPAVVPHLPAWLDHPGEPLLFLNGVAGLASPFWDATFQPRFMGEGEPWQKGAGLLESIVFLVQANLEEMAKAIAPPRRLRITGGVSRLDGLCRRLASLTGLPVLRRDDPEGTARGIAYLAAGLPPEWQGGGGEDRFAPEPMPGLPERYRRWRDEMRRLTGY